VPTPHDRLAAAVESLFPFSGATPNPPDPTHRLATAKTRRERSHPGSESCNHTALAEELDKIADELRLFSKRLRLNGVDEFDDPWDGEENHGPRPIHVEVDPAAWEHLRGELKRQGQGFGYAVGALVKAAIGRRRLVSGHVYLDAAGPGRRAAVYLRISGVDDRTWAALKAMAYCEVVTLARLVGILIEREAQRVGWVREEAE
jgi:hypothetical protein